MRRTINIILMAIILLILVLGLFVAIGADIKTDVGQPNVRVPGEDVNINLSKDEIPKLVEIIRVWKLIDEVELESLGEEKLVMFLAKYKELDKTRIEYYKNRRESIDKLRNLLVINAPADQIKLALDDFRKKEESFYKKEKQIQEAIYSNLTVKQQAKFIAFQDANRRDMRRLIENLGKLSRLRERTLKYQPEALSKK